MGGFALRTVSRTSPRILLLETILPSSDFSTARQHTNQIQGGENRFAMKFNTDRGNEQK
jgi:hypothetical protein